MIVHVVRRAVEAGVGPVVVATDFDGIARALTGEDCSIVMTRSDHASGSDRIFEALQAYDPLNEFDTIVNLQGDFPTIDPSSIEICIAPLEDADVDVATLAAKAVRADERADPDVVKVVGAPIAEGRFRALYFSRAVIPWGDGPVFHHAGVYAFKRAALEHFVAMPPSPLEMRERLEQLRLLEAGMRIDVSIVDAVPLGVDNPAALQKAAQLMGFNDA